MDMLSFYMGMQMGINTPRILTQPTDQYGIANAKVDFSVRVLGVNLSYQWQYSEDGGETWANTSFTGNKTPTMTVTVTAARDGYQYRCAITDGNGTTITSSAAALHVISSGRSND